jgi:transglutaminase-like putative cysteine protease
VSSTTTGDARGRLAGLVDGVPVARGVALVGIGLTLGAFLSVLHEILVITGDPESLYYVVGGAVLSGTVLARLIRPRTAATIGIVGIAAGMYLYVTSLPGGFGFLALLKPMLGDAVALLSGLSVLRIVNADVWALAAAPAPVFLAWYLAVRRRYVAASGVAGAGLGLVVLTGDATTTTTLVGVLGVTLSVAFGDCDRRGERLRNADGVVVVLATMVVLTLFVGVVPGAAGSFVSTDGIGSETSTVESSLVYAGDSLAVAGSVELSPGVRYTVEAEESAYWRVSTYDRYTGGGWVRTGERRNYRGPLPEPPGRTRALRQTYTAETAIATLPAANKPTAIRDVPVPVQVTAAGSFQPASPLQAGESYEVISERPTAGAAELQAAGTEYPDGIERRYTQLPASTPDRVGERTARLTANADNPYDTARVVERYLENNYEYSLDVDRPSGNVADRFLFGMDAGYCTYFATTMVTMLRTQGIPARFAVGYTPGQQVADDEWVVRGYNSHAWVEVYFPEQGWVKFDPTPSTPRERAERQRLAAAREDGAPAVDTNDSGDSELDSGTPEPTATPTDDGSAPSPGNDSGSAGPTPGGDETAGGSGGDGPTVPAVPLPSREQAGFGLVVLAGLAAVGRRTGADRRLYRELWLRRLPDGPPEAVVTGAFHRVVHLEERAGRERAPGETARAFLAHSDERARRLGELHERARYGHGVDEADAAEAADLLADLLEERSRLPHRLKKPDTGSR